MKEKCSESHNIFHTPITSSKGDKFIIKSSYHLDYPAEKTGHPVNHCLTKRKAAGTNESFVVKCAACNRRKDTNNNWVSLDTNAYDYSKVRISHGICPECIRTLYPELGTSPGKGKRVED